MFQIDSHVWREYRQIEGVLRVGLTVPSQAPEWVERIVETLQAETAFQVDLGAGLDDFRTRELDVVILFTEPPEAFAVVPRFGIWRFWLGEIEKPRSSPPYWREILEQAPVSSIYLIRHWRNAHEADILDEHHAPTQQGWRPARNAAGPTGMAAAMLARRLLDLLSPLASQQYRKVTLPSGSGRDGRGMIELARFGMQQFQRSIALRSQARGKSLEWFTALRRNGAFEDVPAPPDHDFADPFLVQDGTRLWLFVEDIPSAAPRARLACLEVLPCGLFGPPSVILDQPYHLSYPFVFRHEGEYYMLPETGHNRTVELYRAVNFPFEWMLHKVLLEGHALTDTTPFLHEGMWYFFTTANEEGVEAFLFYSDTLTGKWNYHPANPICSDVRRARGAGALFMKDGKLIRPSQDCSVRYGYAIVLNEVTHLSKTHYAERPIETILPTWRPGLLGTHTINRGGGIDVVDGLRYRE